MEQTRPTVAILTAAQEAYSETFIQAHRHIPGVRITYYYGDMLPNHLEGSGNIMRPGILNVGLYLLQKPISTHALTFGEHCLARSFHHNRVDIAIAEFGEIGVRALPVCLYCNIPLIVYFRGYDASIEEVVQKNLPGYRRLFEHAVQIMCVSHPIMEKLKSLGCPPHKLMFHSSAPNPEYYRINPTFQHKRFVGIGRFVDKKAPYYTILAFSKVLQRHPDAELVLGGDGPLLNACRNLVTYLHLGTSVSLPGVMRPDEFMTLLGHSLAFVQHSITADNGDTEGTPLAILEAGAASLPVVSTRHAGIPYAVSHGETGYLVEEHDVDGMAEMMCRIIEEPDTSRLLGIAARKRMQEYFNLEERLGRLSEIIHQKVDLNRRHT